jgi:uncharacterized protein YxjI
MESINTKAYEGRIYETKDSFVVESVTGPKSVSLEDPANFINNKLKEFDGKNVKVEITIKISSI